MRLVLTCVVLALLFTAGPSMPSVNAQMPGPQAARLLDPVIETLDVVDVPAEVRDAVLARIAVRVGDRLTADAKQRIGLEIGHVQKGMTFSYTPGLTPGSVKVRIDPSC